MLGTKYDQCGSHSQHLFPLKGPQSVNPQINILLVILKFICFQVNWLQLKDNTNGIRILNIPQVFFAQNAFSKTSKLVADMISNN